MESEQVSIIEAFRLGKKRDNNIRPVLVKLRDVQCKADIMNKCHLLKGSGIFISNDYTTLQRQNMKKLVARMKEAKENGYGNVFITCRGVLMVDGNDLGSVDAMELKFDDENDIHCTQPSLSRELALSLLIKVCLSLFELNFIAISFLMCHASLDGKHPSANLHVAH